jgi:fimbrial chaperone protein
MSLALLVLLSPVNGFSANFSLNPIRVYFDDSSKTNILSITNNSDEKISVQLRAYTWSQNEKGENEYALTRDIVFFPKIANIIKGEKKIVRLGTRVPQGKQEKTYRLYIEEIPNPDKTDNTAVNIVMKIGVPIFLAPVKAEPKGLVKEMSMDAGSFHAKLINDGNVHFILRAINVSGRNEVGEEIFREVVGGRYLHSGNSKDITFNIPQESCVNIKTLELEMNTDKLSLREEIDVTRKMCRL